MKSKRRTYKKGKKIRRTKRRYRGGLPESQKKSPKSAFKTSKLSDKRISFNPNSYTRVFNNNENFEDIHYLTKGMDIKPLSEEEIKAIEKKKIKYPDLIKAKLETKFSDAIVTREEAKIIARKKK
jgi:hypothetical protein